MKQAVVDDIRVGKQQIITRQKDVHKGGKDQQKQDFLFFHQITETLSDIKQNILFSFFASGSSFRFCKAEFRCGRHQKGKGVKKKRSSDADDSDEPDTDDWPRNPYNFPAGVRYRVEKTDTLFFNYLTDHGFIGGGIECIHQSQKSIGNHHYLSHQARFDKKAQNTADQGRQDIRNNHNLLSVACICPGSSDQIEKDLDDRLRALIDGQYPGLSGKSTDDTDAVCIVENDIPDFRSPAAEPQKRLVFSDSVTAHKITSG